jgi:hypothetical protein
MIKYISGVLKISESELTDHTEEGILRLAILLQDSQDEVEGIEQKYFHDHSRPEDIAMCLYLHILTFHFVIEDNELVGMDVDDIWVDVLIMLSLNQFTELIDNILSITTNYLESALDDSNDYVGCHFESIDKLGFTIDVRNGKTVGRHYNLSKFDGFLLGPKQRQISYDLKQFIKSSTDEFNYKRFASIFI